MQEGKHLEHHETELCSPGHRFGPTVRIELGENGSIIPMPILKWQPDLPGVSTPTATRVIRYPQAPPSSVTCGRVRTK